MGSFDDAEICEPAGGDKYGKQKVGLNRDDGLTCFGNLNGPQAEKIRKDVIKIFKQEVGLNITRETNLKTVNFLDVTLNLSTGKYQLYSKPGNGPLCIDVNSNRSPNITKTLLDTISSKRINKLSSDEHVFNSTKGLCNNALKNTGYKENIKFQHNVLVEAQKRKNNRGRKIIWFNLPYSCNVPNDIRKKFFLLLDKYFPKTHKFYKISNRNNVKISYSSLQNISSIIKSHHKQILRNDGLMSSYVVANVEESLGNCLQENIKYYSKVILRNEFSNKNHSHYIGLPVNTFIDQTIQDYINIKLFLNTRANEMHRIV